MAATEGRDTRRMEAVIGQGGLYFYYSSNQVAKKEMKSATTIYPATVIP